MKQKQEKLEMLFSYFSSNFENILNAIDNRENKILDREQKILDLEEKTKDNMKRVNEMTLELKSVVSMARAALSERKAFEEFIVLAEKKLIDIVDETKKYTDKKIQKELSDTKKMINNLTKAYEEKEPFARLTQMNNTLERIEEVIDKSKSKPRSMAKKTTSE